MKKLLGTDTSQDEVVKNALKFLCYLGFPSCKEFFWNEQKGDQGSKGQKGTDF
jgi:hypothetical protein